MENKASVNAVIQNLKDAGCSFKTVERFMELEKQGDTKEQLNLLSKHRCKLLERVHREERRIDCLDYLVYHIRKRKSSI